MERVYTGREVLGGLVGVGKQHREWGYWKSENACSCHWAAGYKVPTIEYSCSVLPFPPMSQMAMARQVMTKPGYFKVLVTTFLRLHLIIQ